MWWSQKSSLVAFVRPADEVQWREAWNFAFLETCVFVQCTPCALQRGFEFSTTTQMQVVSCACHASFGRVSFQHVRVKQLRPQSRRRRVFRYGSSLEARRPVLASPPPPPPHHHPHACPTLPPPSFSYSDRPIRSVFLYLLGFCFSAKTEEELAATPFESYDLFRGQVLGAMGGGSTLRKVGVANGVGRSCSRGVVLLARFICLWGFRACRLRTR